MRVDGGLLAAVEGSIAAADWLTPAHEGVCELARHYARLIDDAVEAARDDPSVDVGRALNIGGPNLRLTGSVLVLIRCGIGCVQQVLTLFLVMYLLVVTLVVVVLLLLPNLLK